MSQKPPALGSLALQAPLLTPQTVHVSPSTCHNLTLFKDLLKEYRKLDDSITMRLNRTNAQFRDMDRIGLAGKENLEQQACAYLWKDLVENWKRRRDIIHYCGDVVDRSMEEQRKLLETATDDAATQRKIQSELYAGDVKRNQVRNEFTVEKIVRQRSLDAFRSRCKYFEPPLTEVEARKWWDDAQKGR